MKGSNAQNNVGAKKGQFCMMLFLAFSCAPLVLGHSHVSVLPLQINKSKRVINECKFEIDRKMLKIAFVNEHDVCLRSKGRRLFFSKSH